MFKKQSKGEMIKQTHRRKSRNMLGSGAKRATRLTQIVNVTLSRTVRETDVVCCLDDGAAHVPARHLRELGKRLVGGECGKALREADAAPVLHDVGRSVECAACVGTSLGGAPWAVAGHLGSVIRNPIRHLLFCVVQNGVFKNTPPQNQ